MPCACQRLVTRAGHRSCSGFNCSPCRRTCGGFGSCAKQRRRQRAENLLRCDATNAPGCSRAWPLISHSCPTRPGSPTTPSFAPNGKAAHLIARLESRDSDPPVQLTAHTSVVPVSTNAGASIRSRQQSYLPQPKVLRPSPIWRASCKATRAQYNSKHATAKHGYAVESYCLGYRHESLPLRQAKTNVASLRLTYEEWSPSTAACRTELS
jgi:hypothetical protein